MLHCVICVFCRLVVLVRLSVPVQLIDWKDSSLKWPIVCWWGHYTLTHSLTHSLTPVSSIYYDPLHHSVVRANHSNPCPQRLSIFSWASLSGSPASKLTHFSPSHCRNTCPYHCVCFSVPLLPGCICWVVHRKVSCSVTFNCVTFTTLLQIPGMPTITIWA